MALLAVILDFDILQVTDDILAERDPFVVDSVSVLDAVTARIVLPLLIADARTLTSTKVRIDFSAPVAINAALSDPTNYIFSSLTAGAIDIFPQSVSVPVGVTTPTFVEVVVSEHTNAASYEVALKEGITGALDEAGDETPFGYTGLGEPPKVSLVLSTSKTEVVVQFDEVLLDEVSVRNILNYTWNNGLVTVSVKTVSGNEVTLETSEQTEGLLYTLNILGQFSFEFNDSVTISEVLEVIDPGQTLWIKAVAADITESAGSVTAWENRRGSAGSTAGNNPEWISSSPEMGGHGVVRFDKSNDEIFNFNDIAADAVGEDVPMTVIVAARFTGVITNFDIDILWGFGHLSAGGPSIIGNRIAETMRMQLVDDGSNTRLRTSFSSPENVANIYTFMFKGQEGELFKNLIRSGSTGTFDMNIGVITPDSFSIGGLNQGTAPGGTFGNWDVAEVMVFKYELTEEARQFYVRQMAADKGIVLPVEKILDFDSLDNGRLTSGGQSTDGTGVIENEPVEIYGAHEIRMRTFPNGKRYMLVEGQRKNELIRSRELDHIATWPQSGVDSVVANDFISPEGEVFAERIDSNDQPSTINGIGQQTIDALTPSVDYTISCFIRKVNADSEYGLHMKILSGAAVRKNVSKTEWPVETWIRDDMTANMATGASAPAARLVDNSVNLKSTSRYMWGAQMEEGSFPSSYIQSSLTTLTRNTDSVNLGIEYASEKLQKGIFSFNFIPLWASTEAPAASTEILYMGGSPAWILHYEGGKFKIKTSAGTPLIETDAISFARYEDATFQLDGDAGTMIVTGFSGGGGGFTGSPWSGIIDAGSQQIEYKPGFYWISEPV